MRISTLSKRIIAAMENMRFVKNQNNNRRVMVITGASAGLGRAVAREFTWASMHKGAVSCIVIIMRGNEFF